MPLQVAEARKLLTDGEIERSLNSERVVAEAVRAAQEDGIVFIDEIDKIVETSRGVSGATSELPMPMPGSASHRVAAAAGRCRFAGLSNQVAHACIAQKACSASLVLDVIHWIRSGQLQHCVQPSACSLQTQVRVACACCV